MTSKKKKILKKKIAPLKYTYTSGDFYGIQKPKENSFLPVNQKEAQRTGEELNDDPDLTEEKEVETEAM